MTIAADTSGSPTRLQIWWNGSMLDSWAWMPCLVEQHVDYRRLLL